MYGGVQDTEVELKTEGYWDELDRRQPNCLTKARPTAPPITAEHFPFRRRQRCHVSSVVPVIRQTEQLGNTVADRSRRAPNLGHRCRVSIPFCL
ncbi:hypothetical protein J6590_090702 [Homalodisca vitripennis]|nr:hypothetical protein J6590_090702 [Homalodisca vitripennis]